MKFILNYEFDLEDGMLSADELESNLDEKASTLSDVAQEEGRIVVLVDDEDVCGEYSEPLVRLVNQWLRKVKWLIGGDTETLPFRNTEQCFGFEPSGSSVEFCFYDGTELEVEEYIVEPVNVHLDKLIEESVRLGERALRVVEVANPEAAESDEDCLELRAGLEELRDSWHQHELRQRR